MKISKIDTKIVDLPLSRPFKMSGVEITVSENVFARVETDNGLVGWGEASSSPAMTGETVESMVAAIEYLAPFMVGRDPAAFQENLAEMDWRLYGNASAKTVLEMAFYDLAGKAAQKPVSELLGGTKRTQVPIVHMLATGDIEIDVAEAAALRAGRCYPYENQGRVASPSRRISSVPSPSASREWRRSALCGLQPGLEPHEEAAGLCRGGQCLARLSGAARHGARR